MIFAYLTGLATGIAAAVFCRRVSHVLTQRFDRCEAGDVPRLTMSSALGETVYVMTSPGRWNDAETGKSVGHYKTVGRNPELTALYIAHKNDEVSP